MKTPLMKIVEDHFIVDCPNKCGLEIIDTPIEQEGFFREQAQKRLANERQELSEKYREGAKHLWYMNIQLVSVGFIFENNITLVCPVCNEAYIITKQDYEKLWGRKLI